MSEQPSGAKYKLLGIDIDGTLLNREHRVEEEVARAIAAAREAGLRVCLATGRSYRESIDVWRKIPWTPPLEPMVLIAGALVSEPDSGRTLYSRTIDRDLACEFADALGEAGHAALVIVDQWRWGWDYVLCETGDVHAARRDWLDKMEARLRRVKRLGEMSELPPPLRITVVVDPPAARPLAAELGERFSGRLHVHAIEAPNYNVTIVEGFAADANKWNALKYVAQGYRIPPGQVAAVGDDVNDLAMVSGAGLGAAMPDSPPELLAMADHVAEDGLTAFIARLVAGEYD